MVVRLGCICPVWKGDEGSLGGCDDSFTVLQTLIMTGSLTNVSGLTISIIASPYTSSFIADMSNPIIQCRVNGKT